MADSYSTLLALIMATPQWQPLPRDYDAERKKMSVPPIKEAYGPTQHPLLPAPPKIQKSGIEIFIK